MTVRTQLWLTISGIIILTVLAGTVSFPKGPDITWQGNMVRELKVHLGLDLQGGTSLTYEADLTNIEAGQEQEAMAGVRDVLERRVNAFGVSEPVVQTNKSGDAWRVLVELPGITDVNKAVQEIGETPLLEFKTEGDAELTEEQLQLIRDTNATSQQRAQDILDRVLAGEDFATIAAAESEDTGTAANGGSLGYFGRGISDVAIEEAAFSAETGKVMPQLVESEFGYHILNVTNKVTAKPSEHSADSLQNILNEDGTSTVSENEQPEELVEVAHIMVQKLPESSAVFGNNYVNTDLTGKQLERADVQFDPNTNIPLVTLDFDDEGSQLFEDITRDNIGKTIAIYLDGEAISTPVVNQAISGGQAQIEGNFTIEEARTLARRLNSGALPVKITLVNQRNVGPTLGEDAIQRSVVAGLLGLVILAIYMIVYYRMPGVVAVVSLIIYGLLLLTIFKLWPITLTLSGVAGFILSLGIAVDANVLIFERMKEELRNGKSLQSAIDDGFKRAWLSIRDSNLSSLLSCLILIWFGSSVIKGFAITLAIGIVLSMFSAITITRTILKVVPIKKTWWYGVNRS